MLFYPNGNIERQINFKDDKASGNAFYFYESGAIKSHRYWVNDHLQGYVTDYYEDSIGLIKFIALYDTLGKLMEVRKNDSIQIKKWSTFVEM